MEADPPTCFQRFRKSTAVAFFLTLVSIVTYVQDILQDILIFTSSITSIDKYDFLSNYQISESGFGYIMALMFIISVIVVGIDTVRSI